MKTYKKLSNEIDEVLGISARRAVGRRMKILARKASVKMAKLRNARKSMPTNVDAKAHKQVRTGILQRLVGKGKELGSMAVGQKMELSKKVDKKIKSMGAGKIKMLVNKKKKEIVKKHRAKAKAMRQAHKDIH